MGLWVGIAALVTAGATLYYYVFRSRIRAYFFSRELERQRRIALDGVKAVPGVYAKVEPLAVRTQTLEVEMAGFTAELSAVKTGQAVLEKRMDEANGTGGQ